MKIRIEWERGERLEEALRALLDGEPHLAYRNFAPVAASAKGAPGLHLGHWLEGLGSQSLPVARDESGRPLAALRTRHREFESQHFGRSIVSIEPPAAVADEDLRLSVLRELYRAAFEELRTTHRHVTAASSTQDRIACWALQEAGCFHVGTRISWMAPLHGRREPATLPDGLRIEQLEGAAIAGLQREHYRRLLEWTATAFDRGPFVFDLAVPAERAAAVYEIWTEKALSGEWADVVLVVRDGDEIVAFNSMMLLPQISRVAGVGILGRGIGASLPGYKGMFTALQKECAASRPLGAAWLETETQAATVASINVFGKLAQHCLRSTASYHMALDAPARGSRVDPAPASR